MNAQSYNFDACEFRNCKDVIHAYFRFRQPVPARSSIWPVRRDPGQAPPLLYPATMTLTAGSPAKAHCPKCHSSNVKVALDTAKAVYYLCPSCCHAWSMQTPAEHAPEDGDNLLRPPVAHRTNRTAT